MFEPLFNPKTIEEEIQKLTISPKQKTRANEWLKLINDGTLEKEETNYKRFENILLRDVLNFPEKEIEKGFEIKNVEYSFQDDEKKTFVCIEAKGTKTQNLFARQHRQTKALVLRWLAWSPTWVIWDSLERLLGLCRPPPVALDKETLRGHCRYIQHVPPVCFPPV